MLDIRLRPRYGAAPGESVWVSVADTVWTMGASIIFASPSAGPIQQRTAEASRRGDASFRYRFCGNFLFFTHFLPRYVTRFCPLAAMWTGF